MTSTLEAEKPPIVRFFHCRTCLPLKPEDVSPREWVRMEAGWTATGVIVIRCVRCDKEIVRA